MLDRVVVLFDEVDELVTIRRRDTDKLSKLLTTYMLPWIQRLRDKGDIVFIFATNHIDWFDPAIKRTDRFDLVIPLGPPQGADRIAVLKTLNLELDDTLLTELNNQILPQATIGEIKAATEKVPAMVKGRSRVDAIVENLAADVLLTSQSEWDEFVKTSTKYPA